MEDGDAKEAFPGPCVTELETVGGAVSVESTGPIPDTETIVLPQQGTCEDDPCNKEGPSPSASASVPPLGDEDLTQVSEHQPRNATDIQTVWGVTLCEDGFARLCEAFPLLYNGVDLEAPCPICLDPLRSRACRKLSCTHCYHESCLLKWTEAAAHLHCPTCRFDLEASALAEFESDFAIFLQEMKTLKEGDGTDPTRLLSVVVTVEHCRRRLFDAALVRHFKLRAQIRTPDELLAWGVFPDILDVLLDQLHVVHQVLETRCACNMSQLNADTDAELLALLCEQLFHIHIFLKHVCNNSGDPLCITHCLCGDLQKHLHYMRRICGLFLQLCRKAI